MRERIRNLGLRLWVAALGTVSACTWSELAAADDSTGRTDCPSRAAVAAALHVLLTRAQLEASEVMAEVDLKDDGARYRVALRGRTREYEDAGRDCARRAKVASVFVAMTVAPPDIGIPELERDVESLGEATLSEVAPAVDTTPSEPKREPDRVEARPPPPQPSSAASATKERRLELELGAVAALAPIHRSPLGALGATGRVALGGDLLALTLGGSFTTTSALILGSSRISQYRSPVDLGVRWRWRAFDLEGALDASAMFVLLQLQPINGESSLRKTTVEWGVRLGAAGRFGRRTFAPYLSGFVEIIPLPARLAVEPRGVIGRTPSMWVGVVLGLSGLLD